MSNSIPTAMYDTFTDGFSLLSQQVNSQILAAGACLHTTMKGERVDKNFIGPVATKKKTVRNGDTQYIDPYHSKRWIGHDTYSHAALVDWNDLLRLLSNPGDQYHKAMIGAARREQDEVMLAAMLGSAYGGKLGTTAVAFDTTNNVVADGSAGLTYEKLMEGKRRLKAGMKMDPTERIFMAVTENQEEDLLNELELISTDYNPVMNGGEAKSIVQSGSVHGKTYKEITFLLFIDWAEQLTDGSAGTTHNVIPKVSTERRCPMWVPSGIWFNEPKAPEPRMTEMPNKDYSWQYWVGADFGASRTEEAKIVRVDCIES